MSFDSVRAEIDRGKLNEPDHTYWSDFFAKHLQRAEDEEVESQFLIALLYQGGYGVKRDCSKAAKWCREAASQGDFRAQLCLSEWIGKGFAVETKKEDLRFWCWRAAEKGNAVGQLEWGHCLSSAKSYKEAAMWYRKAAEQGNALAQYHLGLCYQSGEGVDQDDKQAIDWFRKAATQGVSAAQCELGNFYFCGGSVKKDRKRAEAWYMLAANNGDADAQYRLACMYAHHDDHRFTQACYWWRKAARQGHAEALDVVGNPY